MIVFVAFGGVLERPGAGPSIPEGLVDVLRRGGKISCFSTGAKLTTRTPSREIPS